VNLDEIECIACLLACEEAVAKRSGNQVLAWKGKVLTGSYAGTNVKSWTPLKRDLWRLKQHLQAFGFTDRVEIDTAKLVGAKVRLLLDRRDRLYPSVKRVWAVRRNGLAAIPHIEG
jgi:hypothetical protein